MESRIIGVAAHADERQRNGERERERETPVEKKNQCNRMRTC